MHGRLQTLLGAALLALSSLALAEWAPGSTDWSHLPEGKKTKLQLYLTPAQALDMKKADPAKVAFLDVRTRAEAMYVGMPVDADALVPYVEHQEMMVDWDEKRSVYKLEANSQFAAEVGRRLAQKGLSKDARIILICRSGDRSAKAADLLQQAGYPQVYSVTEGFEGDMAKEGAKTGQRAVNGWKNAGLPWSYKLEKAKMYFP